MTTPSLLEFIDKGFWMLLLGVSGYVAAQIKEMSKSIQELNRNMAVVVASLAAQEKVLDRHEVRLEKLETTRK